MESIHGPQVTPPTLPQLRPAPAPDQDVQGTSPNGTAPTLPGAPAEGHGVAPAPTDAELPPPGVDAELWSVLTAEEREFFSVAREMGPVTYGREQASETSALPRGRRLDVRV
ncbi:MAG: hypothetical protein MJB57_04900 [Gemmatimonadetes bacterium]|nr:hypothetical protein [Gemmatimonadota bacterium]